MSSQVEWHDYDRPKSSEPPHDGATYDLRLSDGEEITGRFDEDDSREALTVYAGQWIGGDGLPLARADQIAHWRERPPQA